MNTEEAMAAADRLMELFPNMQPQQHATMAYEFERHQADDVSTAIDRHYLERGGKFVEPEALMRTVRGIERARKIMEDAARRRREDEEAKALVDRIDATIAAMPDAELEIRKANVLAQLTDPKVRTLLEGRDPRRSAWLKALIFERVNDDKLAASL